MGITIIPSAFCAGYWAEYEVPSSNGKKSYTVSLCGGEGPAYCTCPAFKFSQRQSREQTCKHIDYVWENACLWNPQWHDGGPGTLKPKQFTAPMLSERCPKCGGPTVAVRIAV